MAKITTLKDQSGGVLYPITQKACITDIANLSLVQHNDSSAVNEQTLLDNYYTKTQILNVIYPVGSIYMSVSNTSPQTFLGGTWVQLKDRFLLGAGDTYSNGSTGGSDTHQHKYGIRLGAYYGAVGFEFANDTGVQNYSSQNSYSDGGWSSDGNTSPYINSTTQTSSYQQSGVGAYKSTGKVSLESNMPPYLVVYMWKRTA